MCTFNKFCGDFCTIGRMCASFLHQVAGAMKLGWIHHKALTAAGTFAEDLAGCHICHACVFCSWLKLIPAPPWKIRTQLPRNSRCLGQMGMQTPGVTHLYWEADVALAPYIAADFDLKAQKIQSIRRSRSECMNSLGWLLPVPPLPLAVPHPHPRPSVARTSSLVLGRTGRSWWFNGLSSLILFRRG